MLVAFRQACVRYSAVRRESLNLRFFNAVSQPKIFKDYPPNTCGSPRPIDFEMEIWKNLSRRKSDEAIFQIKRCFERLHGAEYRFPFHLETFEQLIVMAPFPYTKCSEYIMITMSHLQRFGFISEVSKRVVVSKADGIAIAEQEKIAHIYANAIRKLSGNKGRARIAADVRTQALVALNNVENLVSTLATQFVDFDAAPTDRLRRVQHRIVGDLALAYGYSNQLDKLLNAFRMIQNSDLLLEPKVVSLVIDCCGFAGKTDEARELWRELQSKYGYEPDMNNFTSYIECLARNGCLKEAICDVVQAEMWQKRGILPDHKTIKTITSFGRSRRADTLEGDQLEDFFDWLKSVDENLYKQMQFVYDLNKTNKSHIKY